MTENQKDFERKDIVVSDGPVPELSDPVKPNIFQRLNEIRREVEYLKKDATVTGYRAITHDFVTGAIRQHLITHGVLTIPRQTSWELRDTGKTTSKDTPFTVFIGTYDIDFVSEDPPNDKVTVTITATAEDTSDKNPGKCLSYAVKYALLKVLNIETGESEESRHEQNPSTISDDQVIEINDLITETDTDMVTFLKVAKAKDVAGILEKAYPMLVKQLNKKKDNLRQPGD